MRYAFPWRSIALPLLAPALLAACGRPPEVRPDSGQAIYMIRCAVCHGRDRQGRPGMYPPLAGSEWVSGPPDRLAALVLDGVQGPLGKYNSVMPGWRGYLKDAEIAAVITWLRQIAGKPPVTPVEVARVHLQTEARGTFWTATDLQNLHLR